MPIVLLVRHGESTANARGVLAGRLPGVVLNAQGRAQATAAGARLEGLPLAAIVSSPLERTRETARLLRAGLSDAPRISVDKGLTECDYGAWSGRRLSSLVKQPLWPHIQSRPSAVTFPDGESMAAMAARGVAAVRRWNEKVADEHGAAGIWVAVSHGDVIKSIVADALGLHLDSFQRIHISPGSLTMISYSGSSTSVLGVNTRDGSLRHLNGGAVAPRLGGGR